VDSAFFATAGIPMLEGGPFTKGAADRSDIIINRGFARAVWPGQSAIGKRLRVASSKPNQGWMTVVGVVGDVARFNLRGDRTRPMLYTPISETDAYPPTHVAVRMASGDPVRDLRAIARTIDPRLVPPTVTSAAATVADSMAQDSFTMLLLAVFAGLAVALSAIGLYGVISYVVAQRTREIGIRVALGATSRDIASSVIGRGVALSAIGLATGLVAAMWATRFIRATLFGITSGDPLSFLATAVLLLVISAIACLRPTSRALAIDPSIAMRAD
jgi:putative ABC transport system permease protein